MKSFCTQTWSDVNLYLFYRAVKYCCHSPEIYFPEKLTVDWLTENTRLSDRKQAMLQGEYHSDCSVCYNQEKEQGVSYRTVKNQPELQTKIVESPKNNYVKRIEISFDNICNQSCLYCNPTYSSKIAEEQGVENKYKYYNEDDLDVIIQWLESFPDNEPITIKFLGGEPTASKNLFYFLDRLIVSQAKNKNFYFHTLTNGNTNEKILKKFSQYFDTAPNWKWGFGLSNEAHGSVAENIRHGLDYKTFLNSLEFYASHPSVHWVSIATAVNIFSVKTMPKLFADIDAICLKYNRKYGYAPNWIDTPQQLNPKYLPAEFKEYIDKTRKLAQDTESQLHKESFLNFLDKLDKIIGTKQLDIVAIQKFLDNKNKEKSGTLDVKLLLEQLQHSKDT